MITELLSPTPLHLQKISGLLQKSEVVALPTETVYGLAGNATDTEAIRKIFEAKGRPTFDPLIVHVSSSILSNAKSPLSALVDLKIISKKVLEWPEQVLLEKAMRHFWPGPLTFVLPKGTAIPGLVTSNQDTVAIRVPAHPLFQSVLSFVDFPLAAPSANRFGKISPTKAAHVLDELSGKIPAILDGGACSIGLESTILKVEPVAESLALTLLRPGKVGISDLEQVFHRKIQVQNSAEKQIVPGLLDSHYAPHKPLFLIPYPWQQSEAEAYLRSNEPLSSLLQGKNLGILGATQLILPIGIPDLKITHRQVLSVSGSLAEIAKSLFNQMRIFDAHADVDILLIDLPPKPNPPEELGLWSAIADRLRRASTNKPDIP